MAEAVWEREGLLAMVMGMDNPFLNTVLHISLTEAEVITRIPEVAAFFSSRQVPWTWQVNPLTQPATLGRLLASQGMDVIETFAVMGVDVSQPVPELVLPGVAIKEIEKPQGFDDWCIPVQEGFKETEESMAQFRALTERIPYGGNHAFHHYVLYKDNNPIAAATLSLYQGNARLDNIAVRTAHQGQRFGTSITYYLLQEAKRFGAAHCFLDASHQGLEMYKKLGFQEYYSAELYSCAKA